MIRAKLTKQIVVQTAAMGVIITIINACLPLNDPRPDCFPDEDCKRGQQCIAGKCIPPKSREIFIDLACIQSNACRLSLARHESINA